MENANNVLCIARLRVKHLQRSFSWKIHKTYLTVAKCINVQQKRISYAKWIRDWVHSSSSSQLLFPNETPNTHSIRDYYFFSIVFSFIILNTSKNKYKCLKTFHQNCLLLNMYQNIYINNSLFCLLKATVFQFVGWLRNLLWKYMNLIRKISRIQFTKDDSIYNSYFTMTRRWHTCHQNIYKKITFLSIKKFRCKNLNK